MKTTDYWTKISTSAASGCLFFAAVLALLPSSVKAQCAMGWDVSGRWGLKQGPTFIAMNLRQSGTVVTGRAGYNFDGKYKSVMGIFGSFGDPGTVSGTVAGTVTGDNFHVQIEWDNKTTGVYNGTIGPKGQLAGISYDVKAPSKKVSWSSDTDMTCKPPKF